jgi:glutamine synthetase
MTDESADEAGEWMAIEETDDADAAREVVEVLQEAGIRIRTGPTGSSDGASFQVEVMLDDLDRALEALEAHDEAD